MNTELDDIDFAQLIGNRDIDVCKLIEDMNKQGIARALYRYTHYFVKGRWPEAEPYIMKDPEQAYWYAKYIIEGRWPEAECFIVRDALMACYYATDILKRRWPEAEPFLLDDPVCARHYFEHFRMAFLI